ncbi:hypothetical protein CmeUKMEL1_08105 [Cryptosporidium meleagridis]|uniref:Uncharacterized protein n=1 Tax=Cryptosporidium meleagridis TaxID=93969 RepID=A0A2P4Z0T9_9CRYT|nr:hypothetical protein CmeUKMEL1_08105 [Cryptosporidium meleagridis]
MNSKKYFLLVVTIIVCFINLNFSNNWELYTSITRKYSTFVGTERSSSNYLLFSQSFLRLSLKNNVPSRKSDKLNLKKSTSGGARGKSTQTFGQTMDELANKLEKFSISSSSSKVVEATCLDLITLFNTLTQGIQFLQTLIGAVGNFYLLESCLQALIARSVGKGSSFSKLLSSIKKVSSALESQKSMFRSLLKLLNESEKKLDTILNLIQQCKMTVSQSLLLGSPRFESYFGLPEKINGSQKKVTSLEVYLNKIVAEFCNENFFSKIDLEISKLKSKDTVEDMEVS